MAGGRRTALKGSGIPKIIHQIWIGANPRPDPWMQTVSNFAAANGYNYMLWTEENLGDLPWKVVPSVKTLYDSFGKEMAGKADLIRLLALYKCGGIYIDADSVVMKPKKLAAFFEDNRGKAFFGWEEINAKVSKDLKKDVTDLAGDTRLIANGTIGATKENPFILELLKRVGKHAEKEKGKAAWKRVGPVFVTRVWKGLDAAATDEERARNDVIIYPMQYFYPKHWHGITDPEMHKKITIPEEGLLFQYGYSTNHFDEIFRRGGRRRRTLKRRQHRQRASRRQRSA
jgi:mannosyltransferase OCH1-like enzyme